MSQRLALEVVMIFWTVCQALVPGILMIAMLNIPNDLVSNVIIVNLLILYGLLWLMYYYIIQENNNNIAERERLNQLKESTCE